MSNPKQYDFYAIGNALLDMVYEVEEQTLVDLHVTKGTMRLIDEETHERFIKVLSNYEPTYACGGSAANTAITAQMFGSKTFYSSLLANDTSGRLYYHDMIAKGVDTNMTESNRPDGNTGRCIVLVTPDGQRTMSTYLGITENVSKAVLNERAIMNSRMVYLEGYLVSNEITCQAALETKKIAQQYGVKTALTLSDPNMFRFFRDNMNRIIGDGVDLIFCNEIEALMFAETDDLSIAEEALKKITKQYVITLGPEGAVSFDGENRIHLPEYPTTIIDSVGAGDTFAGAFLYQVLKGEDFNTATDFANYAASKVVAKLGARLEPQESEEIKKHSN